MLIWQNKNHILKTSGTKKMASVTNHHLFCDNILHNNFRIYIFSLFLCFFTLYYSDYFTTIGKKGETFKTNVLYKEDSVGINLNWRLSVCVCTSSSTMDLFCADQL